MENEKLAQGVKELRKRKGLSQEELAKNSGLSLRTVQRVENGETEPTGETIGRLSRALDVTPDKLTDRDENKETPKKTVQTRYEYLHIFDNKLVITKTPEINNLVEDYGKSISNVFKTLMAFFVSIPIFTALAVLFYHLGKTGLAVYSAAFALFFLAAAFQIILFTSGSTLIKAENIRKIKIQKELLYNVVVLIYHMESGRQKIRALVLEKDQVDDMKNSLLSQKLIEEKDIKLTGNTININTFIRTFFIIGLFSFLLIIKSHEMMLYYYGGIMLILSAVLVLQMIFKLTFPLFNKTSNR